jgi:hypothetical protein
MEDGASFGNLPFKVTAVAAGEAHTLLLTGNQLSILRPFTFCCIHDFSLIYKLILPTFS